MATQTESIYTRNKDVWKTINRDILEQRIIDEGLPLQKESVDAAHAMYVAELQKADEAKAEKVEAEREKAAVNPPPNPSGNPPANSQAVANPLTEPPVTPSEPLDKETELLLALAERMPEVITEMWDKSAMGHGWVFVSKAVAKRFGNPFGNLTKEVYDAYKVSKGSEVTLNELIKQHTPHHVTPQVAPQPPTQITNPNPEGPNSSTNQAPLTVKGKEAVTEGLQEGLAEEINGAGKGATNEVVAHFERNRKLSDEEVDSLRLNLLIAPSNHKRTAMK